MNFEQIMKKLTEIIQLNKEVKNNVIFKDLKHCLDVNFPKKIRLLIN